jgi:signal transduction histidine kinase/DNA-binding response OmpR family regulator/HPt (histidine-containing phosphotransfer) domain-containing protein
MIELGQIQLQHGSSVYDARNKIRSLANALGYDPVEATRLASAVSEAARKMRRDNLDPVITIALAMDFSPPQLVLDFESRHQAPCFAGLDGFFDCLNETGTREGFGCLRALRWLPNAAFEATESFVAEQRRRIQTLSREELMAEIEQKNCDLERHSAKLEETVARRTEQLEQAILEADTANKAKGDFLANMSHEIRTPMNAIIGLSDLCLRTELTDKQRDYLSKVHGSALALLGIINDILDFSKIEAGKLDIEVVPFCIDGVLEDLATLVQVKTQEKGLELLFKRSPDVPAVLMGDPMRLGQILVNLTNNAVKFTEQGEILVAVELEAILEDQVTLRCVVTDTGIGMTDKQLGKLFQSFSQADSSTTRKYGGTGLGLAISKQLVEMMGGEIWVESERDKGSTFGFRIVVGAGEGARVKSFVPTAELQHLKCLVVDDNETSVEILTQYLSTFNFTVDSERSALAVMERVRQGRLDYDLIVTDWMMPGMNGLEMASKLRASDSMDKQPRIILVSAFHGVDLMERPGADKVDKFLAKPVSPSHLFDAIMECFGQEIESSKGRIASQGYDADALAPIQGASVLLVEDNEINQQVASELLEQAGLLVDIANHGQEAIDMIARKDYDIVLMDIQMPIMDGYTATRQLRKDPRYTRLPILAMTANATTADSEKSLELGMNAHINKPINPAELFKVLLTWVAPADRPVPVTAAARKAGVDRDGAAPPELEGVDTAAGIMRVGGSVSAYQRLLGKFADNQAASADELRAAVLAGEQELAVRIAHSLKGSAGALGIDTVQALAANLEAILKENLQGFDDSLYRELALNLQHTVTLIRSALDSPGTTTGAVAESQQIDASVFERLALLQEQLEDFDSEAEDTLDGLRTDLASSCVAQLLEPIAKAVSAYDMESAAQQLPGVTSKLKESIQ